MTTLRNNLQLLHVIVPQGTPENPKTEALFTQFLDNLHKTSHGKLCSFEMFGQNQYTNFVIGCDDSSYKLIEGLLYATYPGCEIRPVKDYTGFYDSAKATLKGTSLRFRSSDIYPIQTFNGFEVDSLSGVFSVISKLKRTESAWVQILVSPRNDDWGYHLTRKVRMKVNRFTRKFRLKDYVRIKDKKTFHAEQESSFVEKTEQHPFDVQIRIGAVSPDGSEAEKTLQALAQAFCQFNKTDANGFEIEKIRSGESFAR